MTASIEALVPRMRDICGAGNVITDPLELRTYECDGLTSHRSVPALVVLPALGGRGGRGGDRVRARPGCRSWPAAAAPGCPAARCRTPDGVLIVMSRMRAILEIDPVSRRAVVEPGVTNLAVSKAAAPFGLFYAPDPSSQVVCSVGGNVAENSGGAHCLKHGFTVHHVTGLEIVTPSGELTWLGDGTGVTTGYDLLGAFTGSEGTLGIVTKIVVKLMPLPEVVHTLLAAYATTAEGGRAVSDIIAAGIVPAAIEMMDALAIEAAEAAVHCNYPAGAGRGADRGAGRPGRRGRGGAGHRPRAVRGRPGATEIRAADDPAERAVIWAGRKSAFAAVGRISPAFIVQDGVVPRTSLGAVLATDRVAVRRGRASGWPTCSTPATGTCTRWCSTTTPSPGQDEAAEELSGAILDACLEHGGSITGEHGVGVDKSRYMPKMFNADDLDTMQLVRCAFDPASLCNPGKIFPTPRLCGEVPGHRRAAAASGRGGRAGGDLLMDTERAWYPPSGQPCAPPARRCGRRACRRGRRAWCPSFVASPASTQEAAALLRAAAAAGLAVVPRGAGTGLGWGPPPSACDLVVDLQRDGPGHRARGRGPGGAGAGRRDDRGSWPRCWPRPARSSRWTSRRRRRWAGWSPPGRPGRGGCATAPRATC